MLACHHEGKASLSKFLQVASGLSPASSPQVMFPEFVPCVRAEVCGACPQTPMGVVAGDQGSRGLTWTGQGSAVFQFGSGLPHPCRRKTPR